VAAVCFIPLIKKVKKMFLPVIKEVRVYLVSGKGDGGDYHSQEEGHWIVDTDIANPMSGYESFRASRTSWGIGVLGSILVEIEDDRGNVGVATGFGGEPAGYLIDQHFSRFLLGADPRNTNLLWDQMFRASMFYGRKGLALAAISVVDLAIWDLLGKIRQEPVWAMIGGKTREVLEFYYTGPRPEVAKEKGFIGGKVPLPFGPSAGVEGLRKNVDFLAMHREAVGEDFPLRVDCYMALNVPYAIELAKSCLHLNIDWWEEVLHPDDFDGFKLLKQAHPQLKWTTGEHEYTRYGFRKLIEGRYIDILQPDVMWVGGMTELLRISAMSAAYDLPVVPHGSGMYASHFVISQVHSPYCEYISNSPDGIEVVPVFGGLFTNEEVPKNGRMKVGDNSGFGLDLNDKIERIHYKSQTGERKKER
jgi:L-alanine-DL-glutamate epimerase-like enolase superfamily enzyme